MSEAKIGPAGGGESMDSRLQSAVDASASGAHGSTVSPAEPNLHDVIDCFPAGFLLCDAEDRVVLCNDLYRSWFFPGQESMVVPGMLFKDLLTTYIKSGLSVNGNADPDWIKTRLARRKREQSRYEHTLVDGRIIRTFEKRASTGGIVSIHIDATDLYTQKAAAAQKSNQLEVVLESMEQGISMMDANLNCAVFNQEFLDLLEFPSELGHPGTPFENFIRYNAERGEYGDGDIDELVKDRVELAKGFQPHSFERTRPDGTIIEICGKPVPGGGFVTTYTDITARRKSEDALRKREIELTEQNERFNTAISNMSQGLCMYDKDSRLVVANRRFVEVYNLPEGVAEPGAEFKDVITHLYDRGDILGEDRQTYIEDRIAKAESGKPYTKILELANGRIIAINHQPMANGGWVSTHEDITELQQVQARVAHMAHHDELTNLPNRTLLRERMEQAVPLLKRQREFAVLCLDLDRFKNVNDTIGHAMGDKLLEAAADRLCECVRETDTVARLGGDEFAILQISDNQPHAATALATRICEVLSKPFSLETHQVVVGASVGIATAPIDSTDPEQLLKNADMALYRAKNDGRGVHRFFEPEMDARMQARRHLEIDLRKAFEAEEFELHYQPLVDLNTNEITGLEALLRWRHPEWGNVSPADYIPVAEEIGLIVALGEWVVQRACSDAAAWPSDIKVAVNLSAAQFRSDNLVQMVFGALAKSGISARRLELEITENALLQNNERTLAILHSLRDMGVRIAMDDFGTGYSSLGYLRSFPFDKIKIDRSFVKDLSLRDDAKVIVSAVADLSRNLGMDTTAEGVETEEQREQVREAGYTEMQGFLFSPAKPAVQITEEYFSEAIEKKAQV